MTTRNVNALEWLRDREELYRAKLEPVSLVVEADYSEQDIETICQSFGEVYNWLKRTGRDLPEKAFSRHLNCLLIAMVGTAATSPESNSFWPAFWGATGIEHELDLQMRVGDLFLQALSRRRLMTFSDVVGPRRFVGPAALHSAVPAAGMGRVVELVLSGRRRDPGLTGPRLLSWMLEQSSRMDLVDKAVSRFLIHGGELAVDVLDRIIEVVVHVGANPAAVEDGSLTTETTGLPSVMLSALERALQDRLDDVGAQPAAVSRTEMQDACTITLDVGAGAVVLRLPSVSATHGMVTWSVSTDGSTEDLRSRAQWVGAAARTMPVGATIRRPVRSVGVRLDGEGFADLSLVDPKDPLLVFDLDGRIQSPNLPIPSGEVWVVRPDGDELRSGDGQPVRVIGDLGTPIGWPDWRIEHVDLTGTSSVRLVRDGRDGPLHTTRTGAGPVITTAAASQVVRTSRGTAVVGSRPIVVIPSGSDASQWRVEVTHSSGGPTTSTGFALSTCAVLGAGFDPLSSFPAPLLGDYFLTVRGSFGKKTQKFVSIVEGLEATTSPDLRLPAAGGVQPAQVRLHAESGMVLSEHTLDFRSDEMQHEVSCTVGGRSARFIVSPPHVQIRLDSGPGSAGWTSTAPVVNPDDLQGRAFLHVQVPGDSTSYRLQFESSTGSEKQSLEQVAKRGVSARDRII